MSIEKPNEPDYGNNEQNESKEIISYPEKLEIPHNIEGENSKAVLENQEGLVTPKQVGEVAELLGIKDLNNEEQEGVIEKKVDEFMGSDQMKKIEKEKPSLMPKIRNSKFLKIALLTGSLLMAEVAASKNMLAQEKDGTEQQEIQDYDFNKFIEAWKEWKADKDKDKKSWNDSNWNRFGVEISRVQVEMEKMFKFIAQNEKFKDSASYQDFLKQYPEGFSLNELNNYITLGLTGEDKFEVFSEKTEEISEKNYSIVYAARKNITLQEGGRFYSVPEERNYQVKLNID